VSTLTVIMVMLVGLALSGFFSGAETGIYCLNRLRLHLAAQHADARAVRLTGVLQDEPGALSVTLTGTNVANYITTAACALLLEESLGFSKLDTEVYTVVFLTPVVFVFGEVVPKNLFRSHADALMLSGAWLLAMSNRLFRMVGAVWFFSQLASLAARVARGEDTQDSTALAPKRRVAMLLQDALAGAPAGRDQSELIDGVCRLSETPVLAAMVPRNRVVTISSRADRRDLVRIARRTAHACLPVCGPSPRHIIGLAKVDELLRTEDWTMVGEHLAPAMNVSPHGTIASAIAQMRRADRQMAVVTDRGGQMLGIVTLKDLLGEVVGEMATGI